MAVAADSCNDAGYCAYKSVGACPFVSLGQTKMLRRWRSSETLVPDSKIEGHSMLLDKQ